MSKQLFISAHASALALVLLAMVGIAGELRAPVSSSSAHSVPFSVAGITR
ncbi:hypothetical protein QWY75_08855 [Pontixanthobacter aestiaquae]|uniref:Uncharacterized protein n=1 Tax=Pontixanthobacter aestiaquae TaxID=1509367 RepID=A0A844Z5V3_9SPHN|nr:hypothetical protein [Pontixanthobacter aestiaquae]MDN3646307.1 hypothetical protein [Pontixanthobacter aestiaquae]MXO82702.1 hypothetical protein [Pontixanthobacter aestiaquae]